MYTWLALLLVAVGALLCWLLYVEVPRLRLLLGEVRRQQHARVLSGECAGEDAESAAAHAESLHFDVQPLELTVDYTDTDGIKRRDTGVAELLSIRETGAAATAAAAGSRPLFLLIPGNPGLVGFYKLFCLYLHRLAKGAVEFRVMSFVGHTAAQLNGGRTFPFKFQLAFFCELLRRTLAEESTRKIFLGGHSVGAFTCLQLLQSLSPADASRVAKVFMLFPTISDIAATPNGRTHTPVLRFLRPLALGIVAVVAALPHALQHWVLLKHIGLHPYEVEAAHGLLHVATVGNCLRMARDEMAQIGALQVDLVRAHLDRLYFIWGQRDQWAPMHQLRTLQGLFGEQLQYVVAPKEAAHAFVVGGSHLVAPIVYEQMRQFL